MGSKATRIADYQADIADDVGSIATIPLNG